MVATLSILAQETAPRGGGGIFGLLIPLILMFVMMHFLLIRPQKKKQQELQKQIDALQIGDGVVTAGGIHGLITNKGENTITVKVADNVKIKFDKSSVSRVLAKERSSASSSESEEQEPSSETKSSDSAS